MDLKALDQIFTLDSRHIEGEYVTYRRSQRVLRGDVAEWLADNKIPYTVSRTATAVLLQIPNRHWATMFKLTWM